MKKAFKVAIASALLSMGAAASAATVVQTSTPVIDITHMAGASSFGFTAFNTSLGTLTSAEFTFYSTITGTARAENLGAAPLTTTIGTGASLTLSVGGLGPIVVDTVYNQQVALAAYDGVRNYAGASGTIKNFTGQSVVTSSGLLTSNAALSAFTHGSLSSSYTGVFAGSGSGNVAFSGNSKVNTYAVLTYNYIPTPVPEPETYAMLLAGLGLMGVVLRKRKAA